MNMNQNQTSNFKLFVLESLESSERKDGRAIYEAFESKMPCEFANITTVQELRTVLQRIATSVTSDQQILVHLHCHGNEAEIGIYDENDKLERIKWHELHDLFRNIYTASSRRLVLCMSVCKGFNVMRLVATGKPCPYSYVCGPLEDISFDDAKNCFTRFYNNLLDGKTIEDAGKDVAQAYKAVKFVCTSADILFEMGQNAYIDRELTPEALNQRRLEFIAQLPVPHTQEQLQYIEETCTREGQLQILEEWRNGFYS
jgi:hypothetical protein